MADLTLTEWAAIAEIIGMAGVIISLLFVAYSINRNTKEVQTTNDNFIYELQFARTRNIVSSPELAAIYVKVRENKELTEEEKERFFWDKMQELSAWEAAFNRFRSGLLPKKEWEGWNSYYVVAFTVQFPEESWVDVRDWYSADFQSHVDAVYAAKR